MKLLKALLISIFVLALSRSSYAQSAGAEPFQFLFLDANARAVGMGGAYTALATDSNALLYNPAGLGMEQAHEATFMHNSYFQGANQEYAAIALKQGFGAHINYLGYGSIAETTYNQPSGTGSNFGINDMAIELGYGHNVNFLANGLSLGLGVKYIRETIANISGSAPAIDLGALYQVSQLKGLSLGAALQNLGPTVKFDGDKQNLPVNGRIGGAYAFDYQNFGNTVALDISKARTDSVVVGFGAESVYNKIAALRVGFNSRNNAGIGISAGVGYVSPTFNVDYAIEPYGDLGLANRVSVTYRWGQSK